MLKKRFIAIRYELSSKKEQKESMKIGNVFNSSGSKIGEVHSDEGGGYCWIFDLLRAIFIAAAIIIMLKDQVISFLTEEWNKDNILCIESYAPVIFAPFVSFIVTLIETRSEKGFGLTAKRVLMFLGLAVGISILCAVIASIHQYGFADFLLGLKHFLVIYLLTSLAITGVLILARILYKAIGGIA